jgi:hypothetical protein
MPFVPFHDFYPELAHRETRSLNLSEPTCGLPAGSYGMIELYCNDPGCDCRRMFFWVVTPHSPRPLACVSYGWENPDFYYGWGGFVTREMAEQMARPALDNAGRQSELAPALLRFIEEVLLADPAYIERLKRHNQMVRDVVDGKKPRQGVPRLDPREHKRIVAEKLRELKARRSQKKKKRRSA